MSDKRRELPVLPAVSGGVGRREVLQGLLAGAGAGVAFPGLASERPSPLEPAAAAEVQAEIQAADWKPQFLDEHQLATLQSLSERVVPGSQETLAPRFIDAVLAADTQERQRRFLSAFGAIEGESLSRHQKPFRALGEAEQTGLLTACASVARGSKEWIWAPGTPFEEPAKEPESLTLRDHFEHLKVWIADAYYSSAEGQKELGDKGVMFFGSFPDCQHKDHS